MAAQPGWYSAPNEAGMLRYWNGDAWTEHRQPTPQALPPVPVLAQVPVPVLAPTPTPTSFADPYATEPSVAGHPSRFSSGIGVGTGLNIDGVSLGRTLTALPELAYVGQQMAAAAEAARQDPRYQSRPTALKSAVTGIVVGLIVVVVGVALTLLLGAQDRAGAGEVKTQGTVSGHLGVGSGCEPEVDYVVAGQTYTASGGGVGGSCSADPTGESVDVIYSAANPGNGARAIFGDPVASFIWLLPILGVVIFVGGLWAFITRLFRRRATPDTP